MADYKGGTSRVLRMCRYECEALCFCVIVRYDIYTHRPSGGKDITIALWCSGLERSQNFPSSIPSHLMSPLCARTRREVHNWDLLAVMRRHYRAYTHTHTPTHTRTHKHIQKYTDIDTPTHTRTHTRTQTPTYDFPSYAQPAYTQSHAHTYTHAHPLVRVLSVIGLSLLGGRLAFACARARAAISSSLIGRGRAGWGSDRSDWSDASDGADGSISSGRVMARVVIPFPLGFFLAFPATLLPAFFLLVLQWAIISDDESAMTMMMYEFCPPFLLLSSSFHPHRCVASRRGWYYWAAVLGAPLL